eukprot:TRINITY_DN714_c0_g2_i3.p1 TRINITY_DN714_c0_g2~~TRINITY_DN714_c0_g2_i3.p1  ORF type:complete len:238 (+),score=-17.39 TRINITY_DN714_c0_g2_i3:3-716(+)
MRLFLFLCFRLFVIFFNFVLCLFFVCCLFFLFLLFLCIRLGRKVLSASKLQSFSDQVIYKESYQEIDKTYRLFQTKANQGRTYVNQCGLVADFQFIPCSELINKVFMSNIAPLCSVLKKFWSLIINSLSIQSLTIRALTPRFHPYGPTPQKRLQTPLSKHIPNDCGHYISPFATFSICYVPVRSSFAFRVRTYLVVCSVSRQVRGNRGDYSETRVSFNQDVEAEQFIAPAQKTIKPA